jgi:hypothetical protein
MSPTSTTIEHVMTRRCTSRARATDVRHWRIELPACRSAGGGTVDRLARMLAWATALARLVALAEVELFSEALLYEVVY